LKERSLDISISHVYYSLNANLDDFKNLIDQKRSKKKIYKTSYCDLWLRLKSIELMGPISLIKYLRINQLYRTEQQFDDLDAEPNENQFSFLVNPRRSRLIHFYIYPQSDEYSYDIDSYVGLLLFSYDNQSKFILNNHHCQRGDILIKSLQTFPSNSLQSSRGYYDRLFKWFFDRSLDERFFGLGFLYDKNKWHFDLIAYDNRDLFFYEYCMFDMFILTHWLNKFEVPHHVIDMEILARNILIEENEIVQKKLCEQNQNDLLQIWIEYVGSDANDFRLSLEKLQKNMANELKILIEESSQQSNDFSALFNKTD